MKLSLLLVPTLLGILLCVGVSRSDPAKSKVTVERVAYGGWQNNLRLFNGEVELIITLEVGPRIIRYGYVGGKNVFKEYPDHMGGAGEREWMIRGGHRLWTAPEDIKRTYALDNGPLQYQELANGVVRLQPPVEEPYGIRKEIDISLSATGSKVKVVHRLRNAGKEPMELAPWALSVMDAGGTAVIPLPPKQPHPDALLPNQLLVLWPYVDLRDPRLNLGTKYITLKQDAKRGPIKFGLAHKQDWVGYWNAGTLFVKRFPYLEGRTYTDHGCNFETFTNEDMLEVETLGPLVSLQPTRQTEHVEEWELHKNVPPFTDESSIEKNILPRVRGE